MWEKIRFSLTLIKNWWRIFHVSVGALNALCPSQGFRCLGCARSLVGTPLFQERLWAQALSLGAGPSWGQPCLCPATDPQHGPTFQPGLGLSPFPWPFPALEGTAGMCHEGEGPASLPFPLPTRGSTCSGFSLAITQNCLNSGNGTGNSQLKGAPAKPSLAFEKDFEVQKSHPVWFPYLRRRIKKGSAKKN